MPADQPRIYCAVAQPPEGGVPITAITTVHKDDYDSLRADRDRLLRALERVVDLYRDDDGDIIVDPDSGFPADAALAESLDVIDGRWSGPESAAALRQTEGPER